MATRRWKVLPGGRVTRWRKSRGDDRPGDGTTIWVFRVPPHWYRNLLNRRERRRAAEASSRGETEVGPYVHPREAAWYW